MTCLCADQSCVPSCKKRCHSYLNYSVNVQQKGKKKRGQRIHKDKKTDQRKDRGTKYKKYIVDKRGEEIGS